MSPNFLRNCYIGFQSLCTHQQWRDVLQSRQLKEFKKKKEFMMSLSWEPKDRETKRNSQQIFLEAERQQTHPHARDLNTVPTLSSKVRSFNALSRGNCHPNAHLAPQTFQPPSLPKHIRMCLCSSYTRAWGNFLTRCGHV